MVSFAPVDIMAFCEASEANVIGQSGLTEFVELFEVYLS